MKKRIISWNAESLMVMKSQPPLLLVLIEKNISPPNIKKNYLSLLSLLTLISTLFVYLFIYLFILLKLLW